MADFWKRLTPHQLRWLAVAVGAAFVIAFLLSDFGDWTRGGLAFAFQAAQLELFPHSVPCPSGRLCSGGSDTAYYIDLPLTGIAVAAVLLAAFLLYAASTRARKVHD